MYFFLSFLRIRGIILEITEVVKMVKVLFVLLAYLLGSIPFSYLLGKLIQGKDIRTLGSGNIGTTNAFRVLGKPIGIAVLLLDTFKSGILVLLMQHTSLFDSFDLFHPLIYGFASVLGHCYPVWFKFKGGKGVATSFGLLIAYNPWLGVMILPIFLFTEVITRHVSVASNVSAVTMLVLVVSLHFTYLADIWLVIITLLSVLLIIIRHQSNFERLRHGTENRVKVFDKLDAYFDNRKNNKKKSQ